MNCNQISPIFISLSFFLISIGSVASAQTACLEVHAHPNDPFPFKNFGRDVDVAGNFTVVGADWDNELGGQAGAAYVYGYDKGLWIQKQKLLASDGASAQRFGRAVAIEHDIAVITDVGAAYVFIEVDGQWTEQQILIPEDETPGFGRDVSLYQDVIVVGAPGDDTQGSNAGAAWVFRSNGSEWVEEQKLLASDGTASDLFGSWPAVDVYDDTIAIGAPGHQGLNPPKDAPPNLLVGAAYIFQYDGETWVEQEILAPFRVDEPADGTVFGWALSLHEDVLVVTNPHQNQQSTFVYEYDSEKNSWVEQQVILPPQGAVPDGWGKAVAVENDILLISDWIVNFGGAAFVYRPDENGQWQLDQQLDPQPNAWSNFFGRSVALDNGRALIGANGEDQQSGGAYVFNLESISGDLNCDGTVDGADLGLLLGEFGSDDAPADLNDDGVVDGADLGLLLGAWKRP